MKKGGGLGVLQSARILQNPLRDSRCVDGGAG